VSEVPDRPTRFFARLLPSRGRERRSFLWGFVDQLSSSITNFGLTLLAGRLLGPQGLGTVFLGFSAYLLTLGLQRRLITEPLLAASSAAAPQERRRSADLALTACIAWGILAALGCAAVGVVLPGPAGRGLLLLSPWLVPALVQDLWRNLLFRDARASGAAANDAIWLVVMAAAAIPAWLFGTSWAVMGCWGIGAAGGMLFGFMQTRSHPTALKAAWIWWRHDALPFGKWNAGAGVVASLGSNIGAFVLSAIVGIAALGGLRASQSIFAPLTLIIPAISLPGLPVVARALVTSFRHARDIALGLSALALALAGSYFIFILVGGWRLLPALFGHDFLRFRDLIFPIATAQMLGAGTVGLLQLLKAQKRGRVLLVNRTVAAVVSLSFVVVLALPFGVIGAAWGQAAGAFTSLLILSWSALREPPSEEPASAETMVTDLVQE
jgi:O-antigen/teichoic acid export membrane protein